MQYRNDAQQRYVEAYEAASKKRVLDEVVNERRKNQKVFLTSDGKKVYNCHVSHIHFEENGTLEDVDTRLVAAPTGWEMLKAGYKVRIDKSLTAKSPFEFLNQQNDFGLMPRGLRWDTHDVVFQETSGAIGHIEGNQVIYSSAFGSGIDLVLQPTNRGFKKIVRINSIESLGQIPTDAQFLEIGFEILGEGIDEILFQDDANEDKAFLIRLRLIHLDRERLYLEKVEKDFTAARAIFAQQQQLEEELHEVMKSVWDRKTDTEFQGEFMIKYEDGIKTFALEPRVWDSIARNKPIRVELRTRNGRPYLVKKIPISFLKDALFPIFTDATTSYYAGTGDGYVGVSGAAAESWATVRAKTAGDDTNYTGTTSQYFAEAGYNGGTNRYFCYRGFIPDDTSGIADTASVDACDILFYVNAKNTAFTAEIDVVQTTQASTSSLVNDDFDQVGSTVTGSKTLSSITTSAYNTISFDATGLTWVSKTGFTKVGFRINADTDNTSPTGNDAMVSGVMADSSGTSQDPYLSITTTNVYTKSLTETLVLVDTVTKKPGKALVDALVLVDTIARHTNKAVVEVLTLVDAFASSFIYTKQIVDAITLEDSAKSQTTAKILFEEILLVDTISQQLSYARTLIEAIVLVDTVTKARTMFRAFSDALSLVDAVAKTSVFARVLEETISIQDRLYGLINGVNMKWRNKFTEKVGTWGKKFFDL